MSEWMSIIEADPVGHHINALEGWVTEAAADMQLETDVVFWDVAMSYLQSECPAEFRDEVCRRLGLDPGPEVRAAWGTT